MTEKALPKKRLGDTYEIAINGARGRVKLYLRTGYYEDGALGEIFIDVAKFGSDLRSMISCWAILFSISLQNGVEPARLIKAFSGVSFEPKGKVQCPLEEVTECTSIPDVVCRILTVELAKLKKGK
jgi:ribonucleoside-diphosphate reductase alpha chain